jgi:hypothetical protein
MSPGKVLLVSLAASVVTLAWALASRAGAPDQIPYPGGYREWQHVSSSLIGPKSAAFQDSGGLHHIYANRKAVEGYKTGKFPDGSVVVFELLDVQEKDGITLEGRRKRMDVMMKDSAKFAATSGWGFERFMGTDDTKRVMTSEMHAKCADCHAKRKDHDLVFSSIRP